MVFSLCWLFFLFQSICCWFSTLQTTVIVIILAAVVCHVNRVIIISLLNHKYIYVEDMHRLQFSVNCFCGFLIFFVYNVACWPYILFIYAEIGEDIVRCCFLFCILYVALVCVDARDEWSEWIAKNVCVTKRDCDCLHEGGHSKMYPQFVCTRDPRDTQSQTSNNL